MRFSRIGSCFIIIGAYLLIRLTPIAIRSGFKSPILALIISILLTAVTMLIQLAYAASIVRLRLKPSKAALIALGSGLIVTVILYVPGRYVHNAAFFHSPIGILTGFSLSLLKDIFLILFAATLGYLVSFIVREPNILLPAAFFAGIVDYWGVTSGPVAHWLDKAPGVVSKASVHMPPVVVQTASKVHVIESMIGMGDFLFFALFMGVLYRFNMNVKGSFWFGYGLLTAFMLLVTFSSWNIAIPALVPMGVAILATNAKNFNLKREELLAIVYVGILLLVGLLVAWFVMHKKL